MSYLLRFVMIVKNSTRPLDIGIHEYVPRCIFTLDTFDVWHPCLHLVISILNKTHALWEFVEVWICHEDKFKSLILLNCQWTLPTCSCSSTWGGHFHFNTNNVQKNIRCNLLKKIQIRIYLNVNNVPDNLFWKYFESIIKIYLDYPNNMLLFHIILKNIILPQLLFKIYKEWDPQAHQLYHVFTFNF
jgi:hypothetical protein